MTAWVVKVSGFARSGVEHELQLLFEHEERLLATTISDAIAEAVVLFNQAMEIDEWAGAVAVELKAGQIIAEVPR